MEVTPRATVMSAAVSLRQPCSSDLSIAVRLASTRLPTLRVQTALPRRHAPPLPLAGLHSPSTSHTSHTTCLPFYCIIANNSDIPATILVLFAHDVIFTEAIAPHAVGRRQDVAAGDQGAPAVNLKHNAELQGEEGC